MTRWIRIVLAVLAAFIGITAVAGGVALIVGAATSTSGGAIPDAAYLGGSPFTSYIVPGLVLAVVVGGTALWGGAGGVWNTLVGVLIVNVIGNGMVVMGLPSYVQDGVLGLLVIIAVYLSTDRRSLSFVK